SPSGGPVPSLSLTALALRAHSDQDRLTCAFRSYYDGVGAGRERGGVEREPGSPCAERPVVEERRAPAQHVVRGDPHEGWLIHGDGHRRPVPDGVGTGEREGECPPRRRGGR